MPCAEPWGLAMRRRDFINAVAGAATVWPLSVRAQQAGKLPTIGFLGADPSAFSPWTNAFVARLRELGWIENRTIAIEYRWSEGRTERYAEIADEFVRLKVDVIVTVGSAVPTVRQATAVIPIVFAVGIDPVGTGLVASLAKPGGNVTGLSLQAANLAGKRIELLREVVPRLRRLAIIFNAGNAQPVLEMEETQTAARAFGLDVTQLEIRQAAERASHGLWHRAPGPAGIRGYFGVPLGYQHPRVDGARPSGRGRHRPAAQRRDHHACLDTRIVNSPDHHRNGRHQRMGFGEGATCNYLRPQVSLAFRSADFGAQLVAGRSAPARGFRAMAELLTDVCFTPESGHCLSASGCPLCANSGSRACMSVWIALFSHGKRCTISSRGARTSWRYRNNRVRG